MIGAYDWWLSCDPGKKPGFALWQGRELVEVGWGFHWPGAAPNEGLMAKLAVIKQFVVEGQHVETHRRDRYGKKRVISRKSQQTLSFTAGRIFERYRYTDRYEVPVPVWRQALWPRCGRLKKEVVLARFRLQHPELAKRADVAPKTYRNDVTEAIAIGYAWLQLDDQTKGSLFTK